MDLQDVKVGDKVICQTRGYKKVVTVTKVSGCYIWINQSRYRKKDGKETGDYYWGKPCIKVADDAEIAEIEALEIYSREKKVLSDIITGDKLSMEQVSEIFKLVNKMLKDGKEN